MARGQVKFLHLSTPSTLCKMGIILVSFWGMLKDYRQFVMRPWAKDTSTFYLLPIIPRERLPFLKLSSGAQSYIGSVVNHQSPSLVLLTYFTHMKVITESSKSRCCITDYGDAEDICPTQWTGLGTDVSNFFKSRTCCPFFCNKQNFYLSVTEYLSIIFNA